jgi:hypothetical protein
MRKLTKHIRDATRTVVSNFPEKLRELEVIECAETGVIFVRKDLFSGAVVDFLESKDVTSLVWNPYPDRQPTEYGRYLVYRKGCDKLQFATWNLTRWAYDNDVTHWTVIPKP